MVRLRKYKKGNLITSMDQVAEAYQQGRYLWLDQTHNQPKHPAVIISMTFKTVRQFIAAERLYYADLNLITD